MYYKAVRTNAGAKYKRCDDASASSTEAHKALEMLHHHHVRV